MFKMASVLFGIQIGSGTEIVCYTLTLARGGGDDRGYNSAPSFFNRSGNPLYDKA